jgi:xylose isomerase
MMTTGSAPRRSASVKSRPAMIRTPSALKDPCVGGLGSENAPYVASDRANASYRQLFHIDLNDQKFSRYDQDLRFGSESIKANFFVVKLLEDSGYDGPRHFDAHAYRTEDQEGVWDFARGCMRTYLILKDKTKRFGEDKEIQAILASLRETYGEAPLPAYSRAAADALKKRIFDRAAIAAKGLAYEKLDQLLIDLLLGVR